jgi:6-phosphogluconolactonase
MSESKRLLVLAGSYAEAENEGIYAYELNEDTGSLSKLDGISGVKNPTFVNCMRLVKRRLLKAIKCLKL